MSLHKGSNNASLVLQSITDALSLLLNLIYYHGGIFTLTAVSLYFLDGELVNRK